MRNKKLKFGIGIGIILAVVAWEAVSGFQQSKTYYVTVSELVGGRAARQHVRVGGVVAPDSIERRGGMGAGVRVDPDRDHRHLPFVRPMGGGDRGHSCR